MAIAAGYNVTNLYVEINGKAGGFLSSFTPPTHEVEQIKQAPGPGGEARKMAGNPKIGEAAATFSIAQEGPLFDWVASFLRMKATEVNLAIVLADQSFQAKRRVDYTGCLITSVAFPALDAREAKKPFEVAVTFQCGKIQFAKGSGKVSAAVGTKTKSWLTSNFRVTIPGIPDASLVTRVELPKIMAKMAEERTGAMRLPTRHYGAYEVAGLATEHAAPGFDGAQAFATKVLQDGAITDEEYMDLTVELLDPTLKKVLGTFTAKHAAPKKFTWSVNAKEDRGAMTSRIDYVLEELAFERK